MLSISIEIMKRRYIDCSVQRLSVSLSLRSGARRAATVQRRTASSSKGDNQTKRSEALSTSKAPKKRNSEEPMGALSLLPPPVSLQSYRFRASPVHSFLVPSPSLPPSVLSQWKRPGTVRASREAERPGAGGESGFLDENGVVDDMDGYLNYLSLEYDSVWDTKPAWSVLKPSLKVLFC